MRYLKRWESPKDKPRRNDKSKTASARVRELKKSSRRLAKTLKNN